MSRFLTTIFQTSKSNSNRVNGGLFGGAWLGVLIGLLNSEELRDLFANNPEILAILGGVQAIVAIFMRNRKSSGPDGGHKPVEQL